MNDLLRKKDLNGNEVRHGDTVYCCSTWPVELDVLRFNQHMSLDGLFKKPTDAIKWAIEEEKDCHERKIKELEKLLSEYEKNG